MEIVVKRAYEGADASDGYRVLVDRLWPRGLKKEFLALGEWCKDIAPSTELREWFSHDPTKFEEFSIRYTEELRSSDTPQQLLERAGERKLTLVYAARDLKVNHARVLRDYLTELASH